MGIKQERSRLNDCDLVSEKKGGVSMNVHSLVTGRGLLPVHIHDIIIVQKKGSCVSCLSQL